jgi:acetylornithine deacetylase/succinyl-diaminopimelate desuccinylase family protein
VEVIRRELGRLGIAHEVVDVPPAGGGGVDAGLPRACLLGHHGTGERILYFHGHYDVVPAQRRDQFVPRLERGRLHGRGSSDMKSGLAAMIYAVRALAELDVPLAGRVGLCIVPDEETGGAGGSHYLARAGLLGRGAIGMLTPEPTTGIVWNANRGAITLSVTVKGKPAHVGLQHQGVNAFERMLAVTDGLRALKAEVERRETAFAISPAAARRSILMMGGRVEGGTNFNVVPAECSFTIDRRINPEEDLATEKARLLEALDRGRADGTRLEVEIVQEGSSSGTAEDDPLSRALAGAAAAVTGSRPAFEMCPGLLEVRFYAERGLPALAYGPGIFEVAHGPNECVVMDDVFAAAATYALTAARVLAP